MSAFFGFIILLAIAVGFFYLVRLARKPLLKLKEWDDTNRSEAAIDKVLYQQKIDRRAAERIMRKRGMND